MKHECGNFKSRRWRHGGIESESDRYPGGGQAMGDYGNMKARVSERDA